MSEEMNLDYLEGVAGQGFEQMGGGDINTPMLLIAQQLSEVTQGGTVPAGHFYNSLTGEDLGTELEVVPCQFQKAWIEWKPNNGGFVARHMPGGIQVSGDNYVGMTTAEGNIVVEAYMYLIAVPSRPDLGIMLFQSTPGNMRYLKSWNTQMRYLRLPSGKPAPMFAGVWSLSINADTNKKGNKYYSLNKEGKSSARFVKWVDKELMTTVVLPARDVSMQAIEAPEAEDTPLIEEKF